MRRVLLKVSGEALMGEAAFGVSSESALAVAEKIWTLAASGIELALVVGGGNIFRGIQQGASWGMERSPADQIGMLATLINGIVLSHTLIKLGLDVRVMSALECPTVAERYHWEKALRHLKKGRVLLFVGGTGHPYFTTDTAAALRACELKADLLLKATTKVDGVYDRDPRKEQGAKKFDTLTFQEVLEQRLGIVDLAAVTLCMEAGIPIRVVDFWAMTPEIFSPNCHLGTWIQ